MKYRRFAIAIAMIVMIVIIAYIQQSSVESTITITASDKTPGISQDGIIQLLDWWEVLPLDRLASSISLEAPFLIPLTGIIALLTALFFGIKIIRDKNVLENKRRLLIYNTIKATPGLTQSEIESRTGINRSSLRYHLEMLRQKDLIISKKVTRQRHYFNKNDKLSHELLFARSIMCCETTRDILNFICKNPGCSQKEISNYMDLSNSTIAWHVNRLGKGGFLVAEKDAQSNHLYAKEESEGYLNGFDMLYDEVAFYRTDDREKQPQS